ncbi:tyrosine decarboxylase MfnA [Natranaeroarchaeum sulfidigenes]|uniref:Probable L-aspartate decarboxylase n=1 Tax=Natranaeroarchaeum sulfidigenes TaxID=2784880 RepID=A0A897MTK0_9EURY|nr:tyrosine decarboxylase MfnA [Natranaeroarchaeum sulfidigenes]QSG03832.1 L-tyrosine decarboxylase, PLP-dependent protein [Natranaeroarchaeum sulfidigenes]
MRAEPQDFGRVLSSMCTTPHPAAREAAEQFLATNPGDPDTYQAVADLEAEAISQLAEITGLVNPRGYVASGGTEANIQAVRAARNLAATPEPNVVVPDSGHFSFQKAAGVLNVELRTAPTTDEYRVDLDAVSALADEDTVLIVGVAGTTEYGRVDPLGELSRIARDVDALFHVDAAWGGFVLPFTDYEWRFDQVPIDTMTIDPHKMGQASVPAGGFLTSSSDILDALAIDTPYLESTDQATLTGTRSGAGVASAVAAMDALWPEGYREQYDQSMRNAEWLADAFTERGFDAVSPTLPLLAVDLPDGLFAGLREQGWRISRTSAGELRIVCMPHVTREQLSAFMTDLDALRARPRTNS